jgi:hypothetical protein
MVARILAGEPNIILGRFCHSLSRSLLFRRDRNCLPTRQRVAEYFAVSSPPSAHSWSDIEIESGLQGSGVPFD